MGDDERREVARRFREMTYDARVSIVDEYMDALGIEGCLDFVEMAHRLADLIEPSEKQGGPSTRDGLLRGPNGGLLCPFCREEVTDDDRPRGDARGRAGVPVLPVLRGRAS